MGGSFPDGSVSISRMQDAALSPNEQPLLLAGVQGSLDFSLVANPAAVLRDKMFSQRRIAVWNRKKKTSYM